MTTTIPVIPIRDTVIYPHMVLPIFVGRPRSVQTLEFAISSNKQLLLLAQKNGKKEDPEAQDLYQVGTIATILQVLKLPDNSLKVLIEGVSRARAIDFLQQTGALFATVENLAESSVTVEEMSILMRAVLAEFDEFQKLNGRIPAEILPALANIHDGSRLADTIAAHLPLKMEEKQKILESTDIKQRLELVFGFLQTEIEVLQLEEKLKNRVRGQVDKTQREFLLHEKLKAIQKELGEIDDKGYGGNDLEKIKSKIESVGLSVEAKEKALSEYNKLKITPPMSPEASVSRNYLDWMLMLPWKNVDPINKSLPDAEKILEHDHYGLEKVKERIIEYLAVEQRAKKVKGPILCLVGPPGVGKTSLGQSIARATGRKFVRVALGGVRDEAEIRGHRRTYIGSMPGKILQKLSKTKTNNPLFMLDEVDKLAMDFRGDPASALLEVLDPEQNHAFNDHYLEVDYDLSNVMFIATANSLDIPPALLDRMEVIRLPGYTEEEKLHIAKSYLIPKQFEENGLRQGELVFADDALIEIIRYYTREAGVRNLEREIAKVCRKAVKNILLQKRKESELTVSQQSIEKYLGVRVHHFGIADKENRIGQATGLAWTEAGGDILTLEVAVTPGKGKITCTGHLGEIMQESIQAALTVVRSRSKKLNIPDNFYEKIDIHVHVPEGATPKDGPSAGSGVCTALVSALTKTPVRADVAMTGEITLRGEVLPIGGLKEKLLAALRSGIKTVIIPEENVKDLKEISKNVTDHLQIKPIKWIDEVLELALEKSGKRAVVDGSGKKNRKKSKTRNK